MTTTNPKISILLLYFLLLLGLNACKNTGSGSQDLLSKEEELIGEWQVNWIVDEFPDDHGHHEVQDTTFYWKGDLTFNEDGTGIRRDFSNAFTGTTDTIMVDISWILSSTHLKINPIGSNYGANYSILNSNANNYLLQLKGEHTIWTLELTR